MDSKCDSNFIDKLNVRKILRNDNGDAGLRKPVNIGCYSLKRSCGKETVYEENNSRLKYLCLPKEAKCSFDLNDGYTDSVLWGTPTSDGLEFLLKWILNNRFKFRLESEKTNGKSLNTDFVCYRGLFTTIMVTPYEKKNDWCIHATKVNGTIYLLEKSTERKLRSESNRTEFENRASFGGYRFESYICSENPNKPPQKFVIDNSGLCDQFCAVYRTRLNSHSAVYGAEVDCVEPSENPNPRKELNFVEIKTSKDYETKWQFDAFCKFKTLKWWAQVYLVAIQSVVCGFRDDDLFVKRIETFSTDKLREFGQEYWSANVCLNFLETFLSFVKSCVTIDNPKVVYEFYWNPSANDIICKQLKSSNSILPDWYCEAFK